MSKSSLGLCIKSTGSPKDSLLLPNVAAARRIVSYNIVQIIILSLIHDSLRMYLLLNSYDNVEVINVRKSHLLDQEY